MKRRVLLLCILFAIVGMTSFARQSIKLPLLKLDSLVSISGAYYCGNNYFGETIELAHDGTYTSGSFSDVTDTSDSTGEKRRDLGIYTIDNNKLTLTSVKRNRLRARDFYMVPWGKRIYLIRDFVDFVDTIRTGQEPCMPMRNNSFLVRGDEKDGIPKGLPEFPKQWQHLLKNVKPADLGVPPGEDYLSRVMRVANKACKEGNDKKAVLYAKEIMKRGPSANSHDYSHDVYIILGWAELRAGHIPSAKEYLSKASKKLPNQSSSPYKEFLQGLCLKGERQAVLDYVDARIKELSEPERTKLWRQQVMENKISELFEPEEEPERE